MSQDATTLRPLPPETSTAIDPDSPVQDVSVLSETEALERAEGKIRSGKLAGKSMWAAIWILALPVLFQQTMAALVGLIDKMVAGSLPKAIVVPAMDAISIGTFIGWFINIAMAGLGIGGQALIARGMGAGNIAQGQRALGQSMLLSLAWGTLVGVIMWFVAAPMAGFCELTPEASRMCVQFVRTEAISMPFCGLMMVGSMCLHGAGETVRPSIIAVLVNVINIVLSWAFSGVDLQIGSFTLPHVLPIEAEKWGVIGIATGTSVAFACGGLMTVWVLARGVRDLKLERREMAYDAQMAWRVMRTGIPNFLEGVAMWGVSLFVLNFIGQVASMKGSDGLPHEGLVGAHLITVQWESISFLPGFAMGTAAGALAGQYLGAGNMRRAAQSIVACGVVSVLFMGTMGVVFMVFGRSLTGIISREPVHLEHVPNLLFYCGMVQVFFATVLVIRQGLRGAGDAMWTLALTFTSCYFVRLPMAWVLGVWMGWGLEGVWMALCGELVVRAMLFAARFAHGGWKTIKV